jgi:tripartite-type tricarboxylate transporter receptor subunit TctC
MLVHVKAVRQKEGIYRAISKIGSRVRLPPTADGITVRKRWIASQSEQRPQGRQVMRTSLRIGLVAFGIALVGISAPQARADGADFFKGKTVTYIIATAPGGGYDLYGRLVAEYMQKHLPGSTFVVKNVPGAGHLIGANTIAAAKPDGLTFGIFNTGLIYNQLIKQQGVRFDLTKMSWIGKAASDSRIMIMAEQSPIKSLAELRASKRKIKFAVSGIGSSSYIETTMLTNVLQLPVEVLTGYSGNEDRLAMRRGEIEGVIGSVSSYEPFVKDGYARIIAHVGGKGTPQLDQLVTDPKAKPLIALIKSQGDVARLTAGPPDIPADRLEALRAAYRKALADPEMKEKAEKAKIPLDPATGDQVGALIKEALDQPPETIALLKDVLERKEDSAEIKGKITEVTGEGREIVLKLADGKAFKAQISGSRTEVSIAGQKAKRTDLKVDMACAISSTGGDGAEAKSVSCQ